MQLIRRMRNRKDRVLSDTHWPVLSPPNDTGLLQIKFRAEGSNQRYVLIMDADDCKEIVELAKRALSYEKRFNV